MTQGTDKEVAIECVRQYMELGKWLEQCPAEDGQPYYETALRDFEGLFEAGHEALMNEGREDLANRFTAIRDGEVTIGNKYDEKWEAKALVELIRDIRKIP